MWKKGLVVVCLLVAMGTAFVLAKAGPPKTSHAGGDEVTLYHVGLNQPEEKQKLDQALHNLIGIDQITYHPKNDSVTVTFEYENMRAQWIEKALESQGLLFQLKP